MSSSIISKHGSSCSSSRSSWTTPRLRDSSTAKTHVSSCVYSSSSSQTPVHASSTSSSSSKSTSSLHAVLITRTPTKSSTRTLTSSASATSTSTGGCSSSSAFFSARPCSSDNSRWTINRKSCTQLGYATPSSSSSSLSSTAGCHTNHQFLMPLMLTLTYADPHLFSMFMAMVAVAASATATIVAVAKSESSTPTSSCQQSRDTSSTKSRISVEDRVSLEKVASSSILLVKTTATIITATRPKTTTPLPPARTSWAQNNTTTMTRCIQNHTVVSDHHQHCHEHAALDNDNATVTDIFEDHPHEILTQGIPEYFRFADPTGVYGILDEIDILTQRMENYPINLILAPRTLKKIRSRIMYSTQCNDQANSEPNSHRVQELITRSPGPILAF